MPKAKGQRTVAYVTGASEYGGPGDPSTHGDTGSSGEHLTGKMAFAELGMGHDLGGLPNGTKCHIYYTNAGITKSVVAEKLDIGLGGTPVQGHARTVDLWYQTAKALGFKGTGLIVISRDDGKPIPTLHDKNVQKYLGAWNKETSSLEKEAIGSPLLAVGEGIEGAVNEVGKVGGFLGELSVEKVVKILIALGLGAMALKLLTGAKLPV